MAVKWLSTKFPNVRYRQHATRKHGVNFDRCFSIRYYVEGVRKEEVVGWGSQGVSMESAYKVLSEIQENIKFGRRPQSIKEMRELNEAKTEADTKAQRRKEKESITVAEFWEATYLPIAESNKTKHVVTTERGRFKNWIGPAIGDTPLRKLTVAQVEGLVLHLKKSDKSPTTIRHVLADISQLWSMATTHGVVDQECPVRRVKKPRQDNRRMRFLTQEEVRALLDALKLRSVDTHDEAVLSLFCGLRLGEIHSLCWGDIDFENGTILIKDTKNKRNRHAFIPEEIRDMLKRRFTDQAKSQLVFPAAHGGKRNEISDTFNRVVDDLGLNDTGETTADGTPVRITDRRQRIVFHSLRHTFASWLVQRGTPLFTVAELLGHSSLEMTKRYSHLAPDTVRTAALSLEGSLEPKPAEVIPIRKHMA
ncbi:site-specific integrase [Desulfosarcina sp. OttesenSCG-928-G17]|nr:site-specific integrase [Desulfosarcina sp. OttesenSCG-928-G17]